MIPSSYGICTKNAMFIAARKNTLLRRARRGKTQTRHSPFPQEALNAQIEGA